MLHGKEIYNFFFFFNFNGFISILISNILMFFVIYKILNIKLKYNLDNYTDFLELLKNEYSIFNSNLFLFIINTFLATSFYIMLVALCTLFNYQFGIQKIIINLIVILICYNIFNKNNIKFLYIFNLILMPILIIFLIILSINNINLKTINFYGNNNLIKSVLNGLLYFSYNSLLIIPILFKLKIKNKIQNLFLSLLFSLIIFILLIFINLLLLSYLEYIKNLDLPILAICNLKHNIYSYSYFFIILSAILSTLFSSGYSFILNISKKNKKITLIIFLFFSLIFELFSFSNLINIFYPFFGIIGLIQIFIILFNIY